MRLIRVPWLVPLAFASAARAQEVPAPEPEPQTEPAPTLVEKFVKEHDAGLSLDKLTAHRSNYILLASVDPSLRDTPSPATDGDNRAVEIKFQLSLRYALMKFGGANELNFAYTGLSFWQVYDFEGSSPFRTTDHEPELFVERDLFDSVQVRVGVDHQSNGESGPASRSWNRFFVEGLWESPERTSKFVERDENSWKASLKVWDVFGTESNNEDITDYMGPFELRGDYLFRGSAKPRLSAMLRNNLWLDDGDNRGAVELDFAVGIGQNWRLLLQYFNGYGESLLDFKENANRYSVGFEFSP